MDIAAVVEFLSLLLTDIEAAHPDLLALVRADG